VLNRWYLLSVMLLVFFAALYKSAHVPVPVKFQAAETISTSKTSPRFESHFASSKQLVQVHAASSIELKDGRIRTFWFSGSREGAKDVEIHSAVFDPQNSKWSSEEVTMTRERTQQALHRYVGKLGNPVVVRQQNGQLRMFYVTVSFGGWAGSSITTVTSSDEGASWSKPQRLITSPFLNISSLVKGAPFLYEDGTIGLPIYHEFIGKFAELLRIDQQGKVLDKQRLAAGGQGTLQPVMLIQNPQSAIAFMRYSAAAEPHRVVTVSTQDAGKNWSPALKSTLPNPDAAVTGVTLPDGRMLAVLNNLEHGRDALSLMLSVDGAGSWREVYRIEDQLAASVQTDEASYSRNVHGLILQSDAEAKNHLEQALESTKRTLCKEGRCRYEFSYPYLIQTQSGDFHLAYTWNRTFIKHLWFNQAWLNQQLEKSTHDALH
jgi:predicted neuraminidase